mmetsp:Transcript_155/g.400  ORF Transcript_155/g.400 Transcript_155/m.400 type:complete len:406 (-) Transcript_155:207-1424(-)
MSSSIASSILIAALAASSVQPVAAFGPTPPTSISHRTTRTGTGAAPPLHMMHSTGDYLSSLSPLVPDAPAVGQSATQVYLNGLSNFAEWSSSPADVVASPEQYLASLSSTFVVAAADADVVGAGAAAASGGAAGMADLSTQLSQLSNTYDKMLDEKYVPRNTWAALPSDSVGFDFGDFASDISERLASVTDGSGEALTALFGKAGDALRQSLQDAPQTIYDGAEKAATTAQVGDASLTDLADGVLKGLAIVGGVLAKILGSLLQTFAGTSVGQVVASAQASVQGVLDGAVNTVTSLGNVTLKEAVQALVTLFIASVKVLFSVLSAVVKVASDKGIDEWAIGASSSIQEEAGKLLAQAGDVAYDLSLSSVVDLSDGIVNFAGDAGALMLQSLEILGRLVTTSPIFS